MNFIQALKLMKNGEKVKLSSWEGYWYWDTNKQTVMMHCKDGIILDIRETDRVEYTLLNIARKDWVLANKQNTPVLGGTALFGFDEAIKYLKRGFKLTKKSWHKEGMFIQMQVPDENSKMRGAYLYITIDHYLNPWHPSQADMLEDDWMIVD
ncbi:DUF2829 domain-containing protein [Clostridium botulinum]|nr:DUF2829 domain-containing protein [Clostridium botulinum]